MTDTLKTIPVNLIDPADDNLRSTFTDIEDLAASIEFIGLLEPIRLTKNGDRYTILAGHRRFEAIVSLGWEEVKAIVQSGAIEDEDRTAIMLIENMQRVDLSIREQAEGVRRLITDHQMSVADVAANLGVSKQWVQDRVGISTLPDSVFEVAQYDRPLSVEHLAMLSNLEESRRERLIKNHPTPRPFHIEDAMSKQKSKLLREKQMAKLVKDKHLAVTQAQLKKIMNAELATLSGPDQEIKLLIGAADKIVNQWERVEPGTWAICLTPIHDLDRHELSKKDIYVLTGGAGSQAWAKITLKQGTADGKTVAAGEPDEDDLIDQRNDARRKDYQAARYAAEVEYLRTTKPAELIAQALHLIVDGACQGWNSHLRVVKLLDMLGQSYADVSGQDIDEAVRKENIAANQTALRTFASKNSANLGRTVAAIRIEGHSGDFPNVSYPEPPEYENYADDEYDDEDFDDEAVGF